MKECIEHITTLRFKLRMSGVPVIDSTKILCDNKIVVNNSSIIDSTFNKKHSSIDYHYARWNVAFDVVKVAWFDTNYNISDLFTKRLTY